jgi:hypothetical protein
MDIEKQSYLDLKIRKYVEDYVEHNRAARVLSQGLKVVGVGLRPLIDQITFRTLDVDKRATEFLNEGFEYDKTLGVIEYESWWTKVYRKPGYPTIFIDQAYDGAKGKSSLIPDWVHSFSDQVLHHVAVLVDDVHDGIFYLEKQGVPFSENIAGSRGSDLRQVFSLPEKVNEKVYSVLALIERHHEKAFLSPDTEGFLRSIRGLY